MFDPKDIYERIMRAKRAAEETREEYEVLMDKVKDTVAEIAILHLNSVMGMEGKSRISPGESMLITILTIENIMNLLKRPMFTAEIYDKVISKIQGKIRLRGNA